MRRRARRDDNHAEIREAFRANGATVLDVASVPGLGCDLVVGCFGQMRLIEVKDGSKAPSARKLTESEQALMDTWKGPKPVVVEDLIDVARVISGLMEDAANLTKGRNY